MGQVVLDLGLAAAGQQSDDGLVVQAVGLKERLAAYGLLPIGIDGIDAGVADVVDRVVVTSEEGYLEGEDGKQFIHIAADGLDAPLLPRPDLGRDIVVDGDVRLTADVFGHGEVEAWVIDEDEHVGVPLHDVGLALLHALQDG